MSSEQIRVQEVEFRGHIHSAREDPAFKALGAMLHLNIQRVSQQTLRCTSAELEKLQGEAVGYEKVLKWIRQPIGTAVDNT